MPMYTYDYDGSALSQRSMTRERIIKILRDETEERRRFYNVYEVVPVKVIPPSDGWIFLKEGE